MYKKLDHSSLDPSFLLIGVPFEPQAKLYPSFSTEQISLVGNERSNLEKAIRPTRKKETGKQIHSVKPKTT